MTIGDVSGAAASTVVGVKLQKGQEDQQEKVVNRLLESTESTSPARTQPGVGKLVNIAA